MNYFRLFLLISLPWVSLVAPLQAWALQIEKLQNPQSFVVNTITPGYFISSANGESEARDNNGFITKLSKDGQVLHLQFIQGGQNQATLHGTERDGDYWTHSVCGRLGHDTGI